MSIGRTGPNSTALINKVVACEMDEDLVPLAMNRVLKQARTYTKRANRPLGQMRGNLTSKDKEDEKLEWTYPYILR